MKNIVNMTPEMLKKIQNTELDMLKEFDRICRKHNIKYIAEGGTLLGAIRHKGFIPWDDDTDVRMLRCEYEKFIKIAPTELDTEKFFLQTYQTDPEYRWFYARILRKGTVFRRSGQDMIKMKRGIFLDIFPCDNLPDDIILKLTFNFRAFLARKVLYSVVGASVEKNVFKKNIYKILSCIPKEIAHKELEKLVRMYRNKDVSRVRCLGWGAKEEFYGLKKEWFTNLKRCLFEDMQLSIPEDFDGFLKFVFGDYMSLPPKSERYPKHIATEISFIDD